MICSARCIFIFAAFVIALSSAAQAGVIVTRGHIVGGSATGTLVAIDTPHISNANSTTATIGGPLWTTGGTITAHQADQGFAALSSASGIREFDIGGTPWEPDGTPFSQARGYFIYTNGTPATTWTFNLAASGIDLPDGTIIHGVYARFGGRNNDRARFEFTEGAATGNVLLEQFASASAGNLVMRWFDSGGNPRDSNFQQIFAGPITVTGGNGFQLSISDTSSGNAGHIDAVILDTSLPKANDVPAISTLLPVNNKTSVVPWTSLEVTFDEPVTLTGTGTVTITDLTDGSSTLVINLPDPQVTSPNGDDLLIKPTSRLELGTQYSVKISANALVDLATTPNPFPGILDDTTWNFTTRPVPDQLHNVLIVTAALADAQPNASAARVADILFHDPRNIDEAMRVSSYQQIGLNLGDTSGLPTTVELVYPETLAQQKTAGGSTNLRSRMATSLAALGYNLTLSNFRFILYIQPAGLNTGNDGWANLGSNTSVYLAPFNMHLAMHEMGHCLGGNHSQANNPGCSLGSYQVDNDYDASKKVHFGWLNAFPGTVNNVPSNTNTSLTLVPLSRDPAVLSGIRAIRIPDPNGTASTYVLSYRINDGTYNTLLNASFSQKIFVVEDLGGSLTNYKAALGPGQEFIVGKLKVSCESVAADGLSAVAKIGVNTFSTWINGFSLAVADQAFGDDPDGDGFCNGVEAFFGTNPNANSTGLSHVSSSGNTITFRHPNPTTLLSDMTGSYEWSLDLVNWYPDATTVGGTTVNISNSPNVPSSGTTTVIYTMSGTISPQMFVRVVASAL